MSFLQTVHWQRRDPAFVARIEERAKLRARNAPQAEWDALNAIPLVAQRTYDRLNKNVHCPRGQEDEHRAEEVNFAGRPAVVRECRFCSSSWIEMLP